MPLIKPLTAQTTSNLSGSSTSIQLHVDSFIDFPPLSSTPIQFDTSKCSTPNSQFSPVDSSSTNRPTSPPTAPSSKPLISDSVHVVSDTENDTNIPVSDSLNSVNKSIEHERDNVPFAYHLVNGQNLNTKNV